MKYFNETALCVLKKHLDRLNENPKTKELLALSKLYENGESTLFYWDGHNSIEHSDAFYECLKPLDENDYYYVRIGEDEDDMPDTFGKMVNNSFKMDCTMEIQFRVPKEKTK
jgi:hypothetical protein